MYLNKIEIQKKITRFKRRKPTKLGLRLNLFKIKQHNFAFTKYVHIYFKDLNNLELKFYKFFIINLRRFSKKKKMIAYIFLTANHCFSKKSTNARMGKGKGKFRRLVNNRKALKPLFIFYKFSLIRIIKFKHYLNKRFLNKFFIYK